MFRNYLKIALRHLARNRITAFINVVGLAFGIASCILIFLYVRNELNYDRHHADAEKIYRVTAKFNMAGQMDHFAMTPFTLAPVLKQEYPGVADPVRLMPIPKQTVWLEDKMYNEDKLYYADSGVFDMFRFDFAKGTPKNALTEPNSIVISESFSKRFFGDANPLGKQLKFTRFKFTVTGVLKEGNYPSHLAPNALLSISTLDSNMKRMIGSDWFYLINFTYLKLKPGQSLEKAKEALAGIHKNHIDPFVKQNQLNSNAQFLLQPLTDIHFSNALMFDLPGRGNRSYVYIFSFVALFILLIACINYMNMATARAAKRAKEVGIRKVMGAGKGQLVAQFLGESVIVTLLSLILALLLVEILLPVFNDLTETRFGMMYLLNWKLLLMLAGLLVIVGIAGGSYPALYLAGLKPAQVLKSQKLPNSGASLLRKVLVIVQFSISTIMVVGTLVVYLQMQYMKNKDLGFNKKNLLALSVPGPDSVRIKVLNALKQELKADSRIADISGTHQILGEEMSRLIYFVGGVGKKEERTMTTMSADANFAKLMNIPVVKGRFFRPNNKVDDSTGFVINEAAAKFLGWTDPIGKEMEVGVGVRGKVIGVVRNFNFVSLHSPIEPLVILSDRGSSRFLLARLGDKDLQASVRSIEDAYRKFDPNHPIEHFFVGEGFDRQYIKEERMLTVFGYFAALTILIACLGLFGLSSHTAEQRTKEIGIRKVNGASERDIVLIFVRDYMKLIGISLIVALPVSYFLMDTWLQDFPFRTSLNPLIFLTAGMLASMVALATVSYQAIITAMTNPVKALRYE